LNREVLLASDTDTEGALLAIHEGRTELSDADLLVADVLEVEVGIALQALPLGAFIATLEVIAAHALLSHAGLQSRYVLKVEGGITDQALLHVALVAAQVAVHRPAALSDAIIRQGSVGGPEVEVRVAANTPILGALVTVNIAEESFTLEG